MYAAILDFDTNDEYIFECWHEVMWPEYLKYPLNDPHTTPHPQATETSGFCGMGDADWDTDRQLYPPDMKLS